MNVMKQKQAMIILIIFGATFGILLVPNIGLAKKSHHSGDTGTSGFSRSTTAGPINDGGFTQGIADGKVQGRADALAHVDNNVCGVEHSDSYCAGYEIGYRAQHAAFTLLHPNQ